VAPDLHLHSDPVVDSLALAQHRKALGVSLRWVADRSGVDFRLLHHVERGLTAAELARVCRALGIPLTALRRSPGR
jgi:transcriptional regulator with XRE-family HTH domain